MQIDDELFRDRRRRTTWTCSTGTQGTYPDDPTQFVMPIALESTLSTGTGADRRAAFPGEEAIYRSYAEKNGRSTTSCSFSRRTRCSRRRQYVVQEGKV
jgi:hypothetical protein